MALIDIVDEISRRQTTKTDTGDERILGVVLGVVMDNYNKDMKGQVHVKIPVRDEENSPLKWAKVAVPYSGSKWGQYFLPEKGDQVLLAFEHGNIETPYMIGAIPKDNDRFMTQSADEHNQIKKIMTKHGSQIMFEDHQDGDGANDKISILTAADTHKIVMDNEHKKIIISDKENNCAIEMLTEEGKMKLTAAKKLTIQVGDSIKVVMNGDSGSIRIEANKVNISASNSMEYKTDGTAKFSGQQTIIEASSMLKNSSNGMVTIAGSPIKIG